MKTLLELGKFKLVTEHNFTRPENWISHGCKAYDKIYKAEWGEEPHCELLDDKEVVLWGRCSYCEERIPEGILTLLKLLESQRYYSAEALYADHGDKYAWETRDKTH